MTEANKDAGDKHYPPYFLEAHYYSSGLRHHVFGNGGQRPMWAPAAESVGFRDEFALVDNDAVIEFQRRIVDGNRVTWLGVYFRSIDEKLGDRQNYAGIGVWTNNLVIVDARKLLNALMQFAGKIAEGSNPEMLAKPAEGFLSDRYLPKYLAPISGFPSELSGCPFARSELASLALFEAVSPSQEMCWDVAADSIIGMGLSREGKFTHSRALIRLPADGKPSIDKEIFQALTEDTDVLSDFVSEIPAVLDALSSRATSLERKTEQLSADLKASHDRAYALESDRKKLEERLAAKKSEFASLTAPPAKQEFFPPDVRRYIEDIWRKTDDISYRMEHVETTILNNTSHDRAIRESYGQSSYNAASSKKSFPQHNYKRRTFFDFSFTQWVIFGAVGIFIIVILLYLILQN
jgi:outer membrane murein-binding lipoprotein Lpp